MNMQSLIEISLSNGNGGKYDEMTNSLANFVKKYSFESTLKYQYQAYYNADFELCKALFLFKTIMLNIIVMKRKRALYK